MRKLAPVTLWLTRALLLALEDDETERPEAAASESVPDAVAVAVPVQVVQVAVEVLVADWVTEELSVAVVGLVLVTVIVTGWPAATLSICSSLI